MLFDEDDLRIAQNQAHLGYHFFEWLAAVLLYHMYGYFGVDPFVKAPNGVEVR